MEEKGIFLKVYNEGITPLQMNAVRGGYAPNGGDADPLCSPKYCGTYCGVNTIEEPCTPACSPQCGKVTDDQ